MPYDIETDNDCIQLLDDAKLTVDHIYINDVDMDELVNHINKLEDKIDKLTNKVDNILSTVNNKTCKCCKK